MNDELQKQLVEMLSRLMNVAGDAAKFAGDQIPPLVQEKIIFGRAWETAFWLLLVIILAVAVHLDRTMWRHWKDTEYDDDSGWLFGSILGLIFGVLPSMIAVLAQTHDFLLVWFAPRLYIVEWLKGLVSK